MDEEYIVEKEWEEALKIIKEIYEDYAPWGDVVINETLYDRMESLIEKNEWVWK